LPPIGASGWPVAGSVTVAGVVEYEGVEKSPPETPFGSIRNSTGSLCARRSAKLKLDTA
jgi:hypothetical protein